MKAERYLRRNQRRGAWVQCEPSFPRRDLRTDELAVSCSAVSSKPLLQWAQSGMYARPALKFKPRKGNPFRANCQVSKNSELFKKPEHGTQFQWERTSSSRATHWEGLKRSPPLVSNIVLSDAVKGHWTQRGYEGPYGIRVQTVLRPSAYVDLQPWDLTWGEKSYSPFVTTPRPPTRIGPSMQVFLRASGSPDQAYSDHHCVYVECDCLQTIGLHF